MLRKSPLALAIASTAIATVTPCFSQESRALFDAPVIQIPAESPGFRELLDFDGDGDLDAVGVDTDVFATQVRVALYANDGSGRLSPFWSATHAAGAQASRDLWPQVATGDANGDGRADFAVATGHELWTFLAGPAGQGPTRTVHAEGTYVYDALLLDLDGDGADEVVGLTFAHLVALRSNQTITRHAFGTTLWNPYRLERAEVTGDAQDDFVVVGYREAYLYGWVGGTIQPYGVFWHELVQGYEQSSIEAGDIDGDGDLDLIALEKRQSTPLARYRVLSRTGANFWSLGPIQSGPPATELVDLDGDGALDLVGYAGSFHSSGPTNFPVNAGLGFFSFAFGDGQGGFGAMQQLLSAGAT
ncbi:MAG: VCBS repeat-containing protein, partial [Planctomycetes bacterium]|nr:VCBS repeat-containing protein [Planctomycetota bacterium]